MSRPKQSTLCIPPGDDPGGKTPFDRFDNIMRRILSVSKEEVDKRMAKQHRKKHKGRGKRLAALLAVLLLSAWGSACAPERRKNFVPTTDAGYRCLLTCYSREAECHAHCPWPIIPRAACEDGCDDAYNYCAMACEGVTEKSH